MFHLYRNIKTQNNELNLKLQKLHYTCAYVINHNGSYNNFPCSESSFHMSNEQQGEHNTVKFFS